MKRKNPAFPFAFNPWYILVLILIIILCILLYRRFHPDKEKITWVKTNDGNVSWNILFKPGTNKDSRDEVIKNITDYVINAYAGTGLQPKMDTVSWCPCDTLLYNYDFLSVDGAGKSVTTAPSKPTNVPGNGNFIAAILDNIPINELVKEQSIYRSKYNRDSVKVNTTDHSKILAIIDSGIDTTLFTSSINSMIWRDPSFPTLYNFLPDQFKDGLFDQTTEKHGTAVAAIVVKAMENTGKYSRLMILKALDSNNRGSIFSVSCALSYATQKNATLINLSLGYYGKPDSILSHYLELSAAHNPSIEIFAAAGNTPGNHTHELCEHNNSNLLTGSNSFYPACFSKDFNNITSVTQISKEDSACYYQNYSNQFINLGVQDTSNCCATLVGFMNSDMRYFEGSSFATPVASGLRMGTILGTMSPTDANTKWNAIIKTDTKSNQVTIGGKYIQYSPTR